MFPTKTKIIKLTSHFSHLYKSAKTKQENDKTSVTPEDVQDADYYSFLLWVILIPVLSLTTLYFSASLAVEITGRKWVIAPIAFVELLIMPLVFRSAVIATIAKKQASVGKGHILLIGEKIPLLPSAKTSKYIAYVFAALWVAIIVFGMSLTDYSKAKKSEGDFTGLEFQAIEKTFKNDTASSATTYKTEKLKIEQKAETIVKKLKSPILNEIAAIEKEVNWCKNSGIDIGNRYAKIEKLRNTLSTVQLPKNIEIELSDALSKHLGNVTEAQKRYDTNFSALKKEVTSKVNNNIDFSLFNAAIKSIFLIVIFFILKVLYLRVFEYLTLSNTTLFSVFLYKKKEATKDNLVTITKEEKAKILEKIDLNAWANYKRSRSESAKIEVVKYEHYIELKGYLVRYSKTGYPSFYKMAA